jgi:phospholipid/cholesterol/gamma-HCH transport system ATP-binding protein
MKRRVGIARALVGTPRVVLYDEPTAGLDPITKRTIVDLMIKLRDVEGVTTVFVTHDLQAAAVVAEMWAKYPKGFVA